MRLDVAIMVSAFLFSSLIAAAAGASFGHAITFGQLGFTPALMWVLLRR